MSVFLIKAAQLLLSLSILIVLHELGHMIPAKLFKIRVEKFYLFFNPWFSIFKKKVGETEYGLGWLPLGGFVKISGMIDESMDKEQMEKPPEPHEFRSKPAWQRLIVMIGGVIVNLVLGFLIYMMILGVWGRDSVKFEDVKHGFTASSVVKAVGFKDGDNFKAINGEPLESVIDINKQFLLRNVENVTVVRANGTEEIIAVPADIGMQLWKAGEEQPFSIRTFPVFDTIIKGKLAEKSGLLKGDSVVSINDKPVKFWSEFTAEITSVKSGSVKIDVSRNNAIKSFTVSTDSTGKIGVGRASGLDKTYSISHRDFGFGESISEGFSYGYWILHDYVAQFSYVFTSKGATQLGGFGAIGGMFPDQWDWHQFWDRTALISIILAFMNLLPIPALDGGHVMFLLWEMITGRPASDKVLEKAQMVGMVLLLGLLLYANGNDIVKAITGG